MRAFYTLLSFVLDVVGTISDRPPPMPLPTNRWFNYYQQDRKALEYLFNCKLYFTPPPHLEEGGVENIESKVVDFKQFFINNFTPNMSHCQMLGKVKSGLPAKI